MHKQKIFRKAISLLCVISFIVAITGASTVFSFSQLVVTVRTNEIAYHYRQMVTVFGNLTYDGNLVEDGLVAIQILNPANATKLIRTVPANVTPTESWTVEVASLSTEDAGGNSKTVFNRNSWAYFKTRIKNNDLFLDRDVLLTLTLYDSDSTAFHFHWLMTTINSGAIHEEVVGIWIDDWVSFGNATAYAGVYSDWPENGGYPYAPEKNVTFGVGTTASSPSTPPSIGYASYKAYFRFVPDAQLGTYTVRVSAYYRGHKDTYNLGLFYRQYELLGDVVYDRQIDIFDVVKVSISYGSQGGEPTWDPEADLDPDGTIDIFDVVLVTSKYGLTY